MAFNFNYKSPRVIAEIGCNHMGSMDIAKELILLAKEAGAGYVKFQKRNPEVAVPDHQKGIMRTRHL